MSRKQKYVLIGMGAFGKEIARTLLEHKEDILVMDKQESVINQLKLEGFDFAVQMNATDEGTLYRFISPDDVVIITMGESFEDNILTVGILKELGVKKIYARATTEIQIKILERMGIQEVLFPEKQEGRRLALRLLFDDFKFIDEFTKDIFIGEIDVPAKMIGKTIIEINLRKNYNVNAIGLINKYIIDKNDKGEQLIQVGFENIKLTKNHVLIVVGLEKNIRDLIDDNH